MVAAAVAVPGGEGVVTYWPRGAARAFFESRDREVLLEGPAGTGKSYACLWKLHLLCLKHPGMRALMVRKTLVSLTASAIVTYRERVLGSGRFGVTFFGGSKAEPAQFRYPNGSRIVVGGMDKPSKIMSAEYDVAYAQEATELREDDWEAITTRLRYGAMPYQQLIADCNPGAPTHWLHQRSLAGTTTTFLSRHEDNPTLWDAVSGAWTERGAAYLATLDRLTGVRHARLRLGQWVAAEGQVYDGWRDEAHVVRRADVAARLKGAWHVGAADWGWTNPGVAQVWAVDGEGRMLLVAEHYHTRRPFEGWWLPRFRGLDERFGVTTWFCDPSEPDNIAALQAAGLPAVGAANAILPGIGRVQDRLPADGSEARLPRLQVVEDALLERDEALVEARLPWWSAQEVPEYVWAKNADGVTLKDRPVDAHNHGLDCWRYAAAGIDGDAGPDVDPAIAAAFERVG